MAKMNSTPRLMLIRGSGIGKGAHMMRAMDSARVGAVM